MKKGENLLRLFIFLPLFLFSQETFLLPDEADHLMDRIYTHIDKAHKDVFIFTRHLDDYLLIKHLKGLAKKGIPITLITQEPISQDNKVHRLTLIKNISVLSLQPFGESDTLKGSLICIDNSRFFMLSEELNSKMMQRRYSFATFQEQACHTVFQTLLKRSKHY